MALPTTRRTGLGGEFELGALGATYDSADLQEWSAEITQVTLDANAKSDTAEVKQIGRHSARVTAKKLVASVAFALRGLLGATHAVTLTSGDGAEVGGSGGDTVLTGNFVVTKVGYVSPDGMEAEDVEMVSSGALVFSDDGP